MEFSKSPMLFQLQPPISTRMILVRLESSFVPHSLLDICQLHFEFGEKASYASSGCCGSSQAFFKPEKWEGLGLGGGEEGGQEEGSKRGCEPEHEGPRERRGVQAAKPTPRIHYSKHLPGVSGGGGGGDLGIYISGPGPIKAAVWQEQPPDSRPADAALGVSPAPASAQPELHALLRVVRTFAATERPPSFPAGSRGPGSRRSPELDRDALHRSPRSPYFIRGTRRRRGRRKRGDPELGSRSLDKVACWTPGGGGGGGRGKTMPRLRRGRGRLQARQAGRLGAGKLPGGAHRSEALASASRSSDTARDVAGLQQPPPPPGGPSKSLDLGEGLR
ncbi:hypothetical protein LEMLEM_LOCUS4321 [Lemmus lemmus]